MIFQSTAELLEAIAGLPYRGGNTNTTGGLYVADREMFTVENGDRFDADNLLILLSDGEPTRMIDELFPFAKYLRDKNFRIIGIGVTDRVNELTFRNIVSDPFEESFFSVDNFDLLQGIISDLIDEACKTVRPRPTTPAPVGSKYLHFCISFLYRLYSPFRDM